MDQAVSSLAAFALFVHHSSIILDTKAYSFNDLVINCSAKFDYCNVSVFDPVSSPEFHLCGSIWH